jgi:hypothetical protein
MDDFKTKKKHFFQKCFAVVKMFALQKRSNIESMNYSWLKGKSQQLKNITTIVKRRLEVISMSVLELIISSKSHRS